MFGRTYVLEHCVKSIREEAEFKAFKVYVTDLLKPIAEFCGAEVNYRYADIISMEKKDTRTGDEIALEVIRNAGLKVKEDDII